MLRFSYLIDPDKILLVTNKSISTYDLNIIELKTWQFSDTLECFGDTMTVFRPSDRRKDNYMISYKLSEDYGKLV